MNEDKALDIIAKIKADREELERATINAESLYKKVWLHVQAAVG